MASVWWVNPPNRGQRFARSIKNSVASQAPLPDEDIHTLAMANTLLLFIATALAEIVGCYLPWLWLKQGKPVWLLLPAALSLALFAWLLSLHDTAGAGRVYAAYGGVYIGVALA